VLPKRTARIPIRFTRDEYDLIVKSADAEGEARLSAYIRQVLLQAKAWTAKALAKEPGVTVTEFVRGAVLGEAS